MTVVMVGLMKTLLFCNYIMAAGTCPDTVNGIFPDMLSLFSRTAAEKYSRCQWNIPLRSFKKRTFRDCCHEVSHSEWMFTVSCPDHVKAVFHVSCRPTQLGWPGDFTSHL